MRDCDSSGGGLRRVGLENIEEKAAVLCVVALQLTCSCLHAGVVTMLQQPLRITAPAVTFQ